MGSEKNALPDSDFDPQDISALFNGGEDEDEVPERGYRSPRKKSRKKTLLTILICAAASLLLAGVVFAVIRLTEKPVYDNTGSFYFSSDLLSADGGEFTVYNEISFRVNNFADKLRVSESEIDSYSVKISRNGADVTDLCSVTKEAGSLPAGTVASSLVTVSLPDDLFNTPLEVEVSSRPTEIVLRGTFTVVPSWGWSLTDEAGSVCCKLVVWANEDITARVSWDETLLIADKNDPNVKASDTDGSFTVVLAAGTGTEIYFFKNDITADCSAPEMSAVTVEKTGSSSAAAGPRTDGNPEN